MARKARSPHRTEECHWSVPAYRRDPLSDEDNEFEGTWLCERTGDSVPVTEHECARCRHWTPEETADAATGR